MRPALAAPPVTIAFAGAPLSPVDALRVASIRVSQRACLPTQAEVEFHGATPELADLVGVLPGLRLTIAADEPLFEGDVTAVEHRYTPDGGLALRVRGYDGLHRLRKRQAVRVFTDVDCADVARQLAADAGLEVTGDARGPRWPRLVQWRETDFAFLAGCASRSGLLFGMRDGELRLFDFEGEDETIELRLGDELLEVEFEYNGEDPVEAVSTTGWDPETGARFEARADTPRTGRTAGISVGSADLGGAGGRTLANIVVSTTDQAAAAAQARLDTAAQRAVVARGVAQGDSRLRPGCRIAFSRVAAAFEGRYVVTEAVHTIDAALGALTSFSTAPPEQVTTPMHPVFAPGVVRAVNDPDARGRVQVELPTLPAVDSAWLRVLLPGAGPGKGFVALPGVGDEVLVLFPGGDPALGLVLGGLYSETGLADYGVEDDLVGRFLWRTAEGREIVLDEAGERIVVRAPNGSEVVITEDLFTLHSATDLEIAAPERTITITAGAVDFRKG